MPHLRLIVAVWLGFASGQAAAGPDLWVGLPPGPYAVGFRQLAGPPAGAAVWYPTGADGGRMTLTDYLGNDAEGFAGFLKSTGLSDGATARYLTTPLAARRDAPVQSGAFPVVALSQGNAQQAADQAVLGEILASHGYLVVTTNSPMMATPMTSLDQVGEFAERQARDLAQALETVATWPSAKSGIRFAIGHSFGARAALLLAMRDSRVRGLVSLDGGIGTATASGAFMKAPSFDATKATAPVLHFYEELDAFMAPDFTLLKLLPAPLTLRSLPGLHHGHFTTIGFGAAAIPELAEVTKAGPEIRQSLIRLVQEMLAFLKMRQ